MFGRRWFALGALVLACGPSVDLPQSTESATESGADETTTGGDAGPLTHGSTASDDAVPEPPAPSSTTVIDTGSIDDTSTSLGDESTGPQSDPPSLSRLLIFYTPHGYYGEHFGATLTMLEGAGMGMLVVHGIANIAFDPEGIDVMDAHSTSAAGLLTGGLLGSGSQNDERFFNPHFAGGPSLEVLLGEQLGDDVPFASTHLGVRASPNEAVPLGVSYWGLDDPRLPIIDPLAGFELLFGDHPGNAELDDLQEALAALPEGFPEATLAAQLALAGAAFRYDRTRVQLVTVDIAIPQLQWGGPGATLHDWMVDGNPLPITSFHRDCAGRLMQLMNELDDHPELFESTAIVWVSDMGDVPPAHTRGSILTIILDGSGTFAHGEIEVEADQADLAATIAAALGVDLGEFGHPDLAATPIPELFAR